MESLRQHIRRLHDCTPSKSKDVRQHMCDICAKVYSSKSGLEKHLDAHTDISETRAQCGLCQKWFKNATYVRVHVRRIHDTIHQPIACQHCGKMKPHERSLKRHILECHTEAAHKCNLCDKSFIYPVLLKVSNTIEFLLMSSRIQCSLLIFLHFRSIWLRIPENHYIRAGIVHSHSKISRTCTSI